MRWTSSDLITEMSPTRNAPTFARLNALKRGSASIANRVFVTTRCRSASPRPQRSERPRRSFRTLNLVLAGPTEPREIGRDDRLGGLRHNAKGAQDTSLTFRFRGYDIVRRKQIDLVAGRRQQFGKKPECRFRPELRAGRDPTRRSEGKADKETPAINCVQGEFGRFAEGRRSWTAEFICRTGRRQTGERRSDRPSDIADINWLQTTFAAAQQGQCREIAGEGAKAVEETILGAEHDRRT